MTEHFVSAAPLPQTLPSSISPEKGSCDHSPSAGTTSDSRSLLFPTEEEIPADNRYARLLHDCSSPMPEELSEAIRQVRGDLAKPPFRGMSYNTSIAELIAILNIGSISIKIQ